MKRRRAPTSKAHNVVNPVLLQLESLLLTARQALTDRDYGRAHKAIDSAESLVDFLTED